MPRGPPKGVGVGGGPCVLLFEKALFLEIHPTGWSIVLAAEVCATREGSSYRRSIRAMSLVELA